MLLLSASSDIRSVWLSLVSRAGRDMAKIMAIIGLGMPASLLFTAQVAVGIRGLCQTQVEPQPPPRAEPPFSRAHHLAWGAQWHSA